MRLRRVSLLALPLLATACPHPAVPPPVPTAATPPPEPEPEVVVRPSVSGLGFRLTELEAGSGATNRQVRGEPLSDDETRLLLARLPALAALPGDEVPFALRDKSTPPPRTGAIVPVPFPPPVSAPPPAVAQGPLRVTRHLPEGHVPLAPHLSISFSHPMVPVSSAGELDGRPSPVKLSPQPPGRWRWVGTQTLLFEPEHRFPMATDYQVEVPAGLRAEGGSELGAADRWSFHTPAPSLVESFPHDGSGQELDPLMFVGFDQAVDPAAIVAHLAVSSRPREGKQAGGPVAVRLATDEEIEKSPAGRRLRARAEARDRQVFFKATSELPRNARIDVRLPAGTPSAEGPRRSERDMSFDFVTYGPLRVLDARCSWGRDCPPMAPFSLRFSNTVAAASFRRELIRTEPPIEGLQASVHGTVVTLSGRTRGRTTYKVSLSPELRDVHGQSLETTGPFEIKVGSAEPALFPEERAMSVLDPSSSTTLPIYSINQKSLRARLYRVGPEDWEKYLKFRNDWDWDGKRHEPPGKLIETRIVRPRATADELDETPLDLGPALQNGVGQVIAIVEPTTPPKKGHYQSSLRTWVQVTRLGLDVFADRETTVGWVTSLATGAPQPGVQVSFPGHPAVSTDATGLARLPSNGIDVLVARKDADVALLLGNIGSFRDYGLRDETRWLIYDDRRTYKPGEEAHIKGFVRVQKNGKGQDLGSLPAGITLQWRAQDARGVELGKGDGVRLSEQGGFDFTLPLPRTPNLGSAQIELALQGGPDDGRTAYHSFQIEEFRRPEFEVSASISEGPHYVGRWATLTASARYYAGGGLADAPVQWTVRSEEASFHPPNRPGFHFGPEPRSWWFHDLGEGEPRRDRSEHLDSHTTAQGDHRVRVDFESVEPSYPLRLEAQATIHDVNRQAWSAHTSLLVHPASSTVGLRLDRAFLRAGESLRVDALATDIDGKTTPGLPIAVRAVRLEQEQVAGVWKEQERDPQECALTSEAEPGVCTLKALAAGRWRLRAIVTDRHGRKSQTQQTFWVYGESTTPDRSLPSLRAQIVPDRSEYAPGQTAELLVFAPFAPAEGVVTLQRQGMVHLERFTMKSRVQAIKVPIPPGSYPSVEASVELVGATVRKNAAGEEDPKLPLQPASASETVALLVPPTARRLSVQAKARDEALEPGGATTIDVDLRDAQGAPVAGAEVAVAVVDEAILALGDYHLPDPLETFYAPRPGGVVSLGSRGDVLLGTPSTVQVSTRSRGDEGVMLGGAKAGRMAASAAPTVMPAPMAEMADKKPQEPMKKAEREESSKDDDATRSGEGSDGRSPSTPITERKDFSPLAAFVPAARSDAGGRVSVPLKLPDSLTRYRIMVVAAREQSFGEGEGTLVARLPLMVRPSAPRFLNFGDRFELPVVLQNQSARAMEVDLVARATNATMGEANGRRVRVPPNDRVEVRLPAAAARAGTARFQIGASSGRFADASKVELPVWTPATTEAFATYGQIDEGAVTQAIKPPAGVVPDYGGLEITTSSTALSSLTDAFLYLVHYPFDCNEQIASRMLSIASLRDVLAAFQAPGLPSKSALEASMKSDLQRLQGRQHWNGGFSFWGRDREPWPYLTVHVMNAVARAQAKGYVPPPELVSRGREYLRTIDQHFEPFYSPESRRYIRAYALAVRQQLGEPDPAGARRLLQEAGGVEKMPLEALGWLLPVLAGDRASAATTEDILHHLANRVSETAGAAHFVTSYSDGAHVLLHSERTADGILLEALIGTAPKSDLIPKLVAGLLNHRKAGRWSSTQENAFILLGLDRYFSTYEKTTPDFVARAWLGAGLAMDEPFRGRQTDSREVKVPMKLLSATGEAPLTIQKEGAGRLYYRLGLNYAPADLRPPPVDRGFAVQRSYEGVDRKDDVKHEADGSWRMKAGALVRVRLAMVASSRRYHVALVDPMPAGLEALNPSLAVSPSVPHDPKAKESPMWWWSRSWYEHQNLRDERAEAFASLLPEGVYDYSYVARATTPGRFIVPPPRAEEMYAPETFGRGAADVVVVE